jgi:dTDP-4-amino-4,6-dideoxygalactose transaminase
MTVGGAVEVVQKLAAPAGVDGESGADSTPARRVNVGELILGPRERLHLQRVIDSNRLSYGPVTLEFETTFARLHDSPYSCFCNSGTSALQIALLALKELRGWQDGDEVIVPAVTFVATVNVVLQSGLRPVLSDVEPDTFNIDPRRIATAITPRTRCIMPVHLLGLPADMDPILDLAKRHRLAVVEDSCETMFARYKGRAVGSFGDIGCFSTYIAHLLVTGVGGLAMTADPDLARLLRSLMNHGRDNICVTVGEDDETGKPRFQETMTRPFRFERVGFSYRCTELEAAIGLAQVEQWETILASRRATAAFFSRELADLSDVLQLPVTPPDRDHAFMVYGLVVRGRSARPLMRHLEGCDIETREMLPLIHQPVYREWLGAEVGLRFPVAEHLHERAFYIGCHQFMDDADRKHVVRAIREFYGR